MFIVFHWLLTEISMASELYFSNKTERTPGGMDPVVVSCERKRNCIPADFPSSTVLAVSPKICITMKMRRTVTRKTRKRRKRKPTDQVSSAWINASSCIKANEFEPNGSKILLEPSLSCFPTARRETRLSIPNIGFNYSETPEVSLSFFLVERQKRGRPESISLQTSETMLDKRYTTSPTCAR